MDMEAVVRWTGGLQFVGRGGSGHGVLMDASPEVGGSDEAARPAELLLLSLGGCTGMDVVSILDKMKISYHRFEVALSAERAPEYPKSFRKIELVYRLWGEVPEEKLRRAIELSLERYCTVAHSLKAGVRIDYRYEIHPET